MSANKEKISLKDFKILVSNSLDADNPTSKLATTRIVHNYRYKLPELFATHVFSYLNDNPHITESKQPDAYMRLVNVATFSRRADNYKELIISIVLDGLQYAGGAVRENARKTVKNLGFILDRPEVLGLRDGKEFTEVLFKVELLLEQNAPKNIPMHLEGLAPSVYKTLALTWHDMMSMHRLYESLNYLERMLDKDIPTLYKLEDDDEEFEPEDLSIAEWEDCIEDYFDFEHSVDIDKLVRAHEQRTIETLRWALMVTAQSNKEAEILRIAGQNDSFLLTRVLTNMLLGKVDQLAGPKIQDEAVHKSFNKVARAIQSIDNNIVLISASGLSFTRIITTVAIDESWMSTPQKIKLQPLLEAFQEAHLEIDRVVDLCFRTDEKRLIDSLATLGIPRRSIDYTEYSQIAHYILDWIIQSDYKLITRKTSKLLAVSIWSVFCHLNPSVSLYGSEQKNLPAMRCVRAQASVRHAAGFWGYCRRTCWTQQFYWFNTNVRFLK